MRECLGIILGVLLIAGMGTTIGVVDDRVGGGTSLNPVPGTVCMNGNYLYFDSACSQMSIVDSSGNMAFTAGGVEAFVIASTVNNFKRYINLESTGARISFSSSLLGEFRGVADDSMQLCTEDDNNFQNNNWMIVPRSSCGNDYSLDVPSPHPRLYFGSQNGSGSPAEKGWISHEGSSFVISSDTGPVTIKRTVGANAKTLTSSDTLDNIHQIVYLDATSNDVTATLPSAATCAGALFRVKRIDGSTWAATLASSDNIDGSASLSLSPNDSWLVHCYNSTYYKH